MYCFCHNFFDLLFLDSAHFVQAEEVVGGHVQDFGYLHEGFERGLAAVGAPFADRGGVFAQLLGQPLVGVLLVGQHRLDSVQILRHRSSTFD